MTVRGGNGSHEVVALRKNSPFAVELSWHGVTDVGHRREINQDSYIAFPTLFAVADGMGGHEAGEVASAAVVRRLAELGSEPGHTREQLESTISDAIEDIEINAGASDLGSGTTVTGLLLGDDEESPSWTVFNIGDSRVYQYFKGALTQLTVDHSVVQHLVDTGQITAEEAVYHPHSNVITRAVGMGEDPTPDYSNLAVVPGQRLLVCSDGLTKELTDAGIQHYLEISETAKEAAESLVQQSLENAGRDNVTVIVIDVHAVGDSRDTAEAPTIPTVDVD